MQMNQPFPNHLKEFITHLLPAADWATAQAAGEYRPVSLETEGFIHFSTPAQILAVANDFYHGQIDLVLLWVDPDRLNFPLRWEPPFPPAHQDEPGMLFPHLYGPLNLDAVMGIVQFTADSDGIFRTVLSP